MEEHQTTGRVHKLELTNRKKALLTGVKDVKSFDEQEILLETDMGMMLISGSELHVDRLTIDKGEIDITGKIDRIIYTELKGRLKSGESVFKRLFR